MCLDNVKNDGIIIIEFEKARILFWKSKDLGVKCRRDGELPVGRRNACFAVMVLHPASYGKGIIFYKSFFPAICCEERRFFYEKREE